MGRVSPGLQICCGLVNTNSAREHCGFDAAAKTAILRAMIRPAPQTAKPAAAPPRGLIWLIVTLCLLLATAALGAVYFLLLEAPSGGAKVRALLGDKLVSFLPDYARFETERAGGRMEQIDLAANFPDFGPAGEIKGLSPSSDLHLRQDHVIFVTLTPAGAGLDPAERMTKLYQRFLETEEWSHPGGLVMRRFAAGSPFADEDLYYAPPEGKLFAARCARPAASPDGLPDACLYDFNQSGLNVQLRFSPARLADWEALTQGARQLVAQVLR